MTILATIDGSDRSWLIVPHAQLLASVLDVPLVVARVLHPLIDLTDEFPGPVSVAAEDQARTWESDLQGEIEERGLAGTAKVPVVLHREGVDDTIARAASELGALAIAMNSRGTGVLHHALVGSTAMGVVGKAGIPVLLSGPRIVPPASAGRYRLLAACDGSPAAGQGVAAFATLFAGRGEIEVTLLGVYSKALGDHGPMREMATARRHLEEFRDLFEGGPRLLTTEVEAEGFESVPHAILRTAEELQAHAIAMASHGHSVVRHVFAGSTALAVLRQSKVPVLVYGVR